MSKMLQKSKSEKLKEAKRKHGFVKIMISKNRKKQLRAGKVKRK